MQLGGLMSGSSAVFINNKFLTCSNPLLSLVFKMSLQNQLFIKLLLIAGVTDLWRSLDIGTWQFLTS